MPDQVQRVERPGKTERHLPRGDERPPFDRDRLADAGGRKSVPRPGRDDVDPRDFQAAPGLGPTAHDTIPREIRQSVGETFGQSLRRPVGYRQRPVDHQRSRAASRPRPGRQGRPGDGHARSLDRSPGRWRRQRHPRTLQGWGDSATRGEQEGGRQPEPAGCREETECAMHRGSSRSRRSCGGSHSWGRPRGRIRPAGRAIEADDQAGAESPADAIAWRRREWDAPRRTRT